jgi:DNA repair exonuclease SbcCD ATPase subunit
MTNFQIADSDEKEPSRKTADADAKPTEESETPDAESAAAPDDGEPKSSDKRGTPDKESTNEATSERRETVEIQWLSEEDGDELPLADAVEANAGLLADLESEDDLESVKRAVERLRAEVDELEGIKRTIEGLRAEVDELRGEVESLQERTESFEGWKGQTINELNSHSNNIRRLVAASDLTVTGTCPKCNDGPLEKKRPFTGAHRIECTNENCRYVAAELE